MGDRSRHADTTEPKLTLDQKLRLCSLLLKAQAGEQYACQEGPRTEHLTATADEPEDPVLMKFFEVVTHTEDVQPLERFERLLRAKGVEPGSLPRLEDSPSFRPYYYELSSCLDVAERSQHEELLGALLDLEEESAEEAYRHLREEGSLPFYQGEAGIGVRQLATASFLTGSEPRRFVPAVMRDLKPPPLRHEGPEKTGYRPVGHNSSAWISDSSPQQAPSPSRQVEQTIAELWQAVPEIQARFDAARHPSGWTELFRAVAGFDTAEDDALLERLDDLRAALQSTAGAVSRASGTSSSARAPDRDDASASEDIWKKLSQKLRGAPQVLRRLGTADNLRGLNLVFLFLSLAESHSARRFGAELLDELDDAIASLDPLGLDADARPAWKAVGFAFLLCPILGRIGGERVELFVELGERLLLKLEQAHQRMPAGTEPDELRRLTFVFGFGMLGGLTEIAFNRGDVRALISRIGRSPAVAWAAQGCKHLEKELAMARA